MTRFKRVRNVLSICHSYCAFFSQVVLSVIFVAVLLVLFNMLDLAVLLLLLSLFLDQVNYEFSLHREIRCEYSPWGREESDMTERLHFHFSLSCTGEGTHSSALARRIPGTGEPGGLPSMGSHRVGHD